MALTTTKRNARNAARELLDTLNAYKKRTKGIASVKASYFYDYVRIDIHAPKSKGKVYNEMVNYLTNRMYSREADSNADWYRSHDEYLVDNNLVPEGEIIIDVRVYHW